MSANYHIHPRAVQGVLKSTASEAEALTSAAKKTLAAIHSANSACDDPQFIGPAIVAFGNSVSGNLNRVFERTKVVLETARDATQEYINADMQMTQNVVHEQRAGLSHLPKA